MVSKVSAAAVGVAAATLVVGATSVGCGSKQSSSPPSTKSSSATTSSAPSSATATSSGPAAQPSDYSNLLIKASDIVAPGDTFTLTQTVPVPSPGGVNGLFGNQGFSRTIDDTIYVYPDAAAAVQARNMAAQAITDPDLGVKGGSPTPIDIGNGGTMAVGTTTKQDGPKSKASVMFTEGKVFVDLEFESPPNDPVPSDFALDVARKQDAAIKSGLPA
ncbi:hypothetical protein ACKUVQ_10750 [Mycobacterium seoulense]|uniref:hypothetical protein n=1 Tax=Mycobacterium seoulense TaxID=386911 RepID=UPI003CEA6945